MSHSPFNAPKLYKKFGYWGLFFASTLLLMIATFTWQLPTILKQIPSRYVARLPEPLQEIGKRGDENPLLPTVSASLSAEILLQDTGDLTPKNQNAVALPPPLISSSILTTGLSADVQAIPTAVPTLAPLPTPTFPPLPDSMRLKGFRHQFQTWNNCGPATIAMSLSYFGLQLNQEATAAFLKPNPEDRNVSPYQLAAYVNEQTPYTALDRTNGSLETIKRLVANGFPVIIELGIEPPGEYRWLGWYGHYLLIVAYDDTLEQFWVYDSWFGTSETPMENDTANGRILHYEEADQQWRQFNRNYLVLYRPEQGPQVTSIIGADMDDRRMWQGALSRVQAELEQEPEDAFLWFNLGTTYNALGQYEKAVTAFDQARAIGLPWRMLWYQFGPYEAYHQVGRYEEVILLADVTLKDRPYFEESFYYKGAALQAMGEMESARKNFERATLFNPNFQPAWDALQKITAKAIDN